MKFLNKTKGAIKYPILILLSLLIIIGCDKAKETVEEAADNVVDKSEELISEAAEKVGDASEEVIKKIAEDTVENNFLVGNWNGKFDSRKTVMIIAEQDGNNFKGKITINYRDAINQELKGSYNPETNVITMEDQLHSRYKGTYSGKLSEDKTEYSGQFTMKLDGKKMNFNLKKK